MGKKEKSSAIVSPSPAAPPARRQRDRVLIGLLVLAAFIRLFHLGHAELWQDELGFFALSDGRLSFGDILHNGWRNIVSIAQLPLAMLLFNAFYRLVDFFGEPVTLLTAGTARLPAALFGIGAVWSTYRLATRVLERGVARVAGLVMAISFYPVFYSREVYCYSQILALTPLALLLLVKVIFDGQRAARSLLLLFIATTALLYSHLGALMAVAGLSACVLIAWFYHLKRDAKLARGFLLAGIVLAAALAAVAPYVLKFVTENQAHTAGSPHAPWTILNDVICKLFLGTKPGLGAVAWMVFAIGVLSLAWPKRPHRGARLLLAGTALLGLIALTWATHRSQYLSARYFAPVAPLVLLVFAQGFGELADRVASAFKLAARGRAITLALVAAPYLLMHGFIFTPAALRLTEKDTPFRAIAAWVNANLEPGVPYLMESAYEIRWVGGPGGYETPRNQPAQPYIHGDLGELHRRQIAFMERFPESPFVESAHHNWNTPEGIWDWPHKNFRQHARVGNPDLLWKLTEWGLYPREPGETVRPTLFTADIYFNRPGDRAMRTRESGSEAMILPVGWQVGGRQTGPQSAEYFRYVPNGTGMLRLTNLAGRTISGQLELVMAADAPAGRPVPVVLLRDGAPLEQLQLEPGRFGSVSVKLADLPAEGALISLRRPDAGPLLLMESAWRSGTN